MDTRIKILTKNLEQKIHEKFCAQGINVMPLKIEGTFYINYRNFDYFFNFEDVGGNMVFTIGVKPVEGMVEGLEVILSRIRGQMPSNNQFGKSRYFADYVLSANGEYVNFSCRVKKVPKSEQAETLFRNIIWGEVIQRIMRGVYNTG